MDLLADVAPFYLTVELATSPREFYSPLKMGGHLVSAADIGRKILNSGRKTASLKVLRMIRIQFLLSSTISIARIVNVY